MLCALLNVNVTANWSYLCFVLYLKSMLQLTCLTYALCFTLSQCYSWLVQPYDLWVYLKSMLQAHVLTLCYVCLFRFWCFLKNYSHVVSTMQNNTQEELTNNKNRYMVIICDFGETSFGADWYHFINVCIVTIYIQILV